MAEAALGLGSNLGDKRRNLAKALSRIEARGVRVLRRSADYRTEPWGFADQDWFVNACALVETTLTPDELLVLCQEVERELGRTREVRWGPRTIDIDILVYEGVTQDTPALMLPHPLVLERAFVLVPLAEIAPDLEIRGRRVADALAQIDKEGVTRLD